MKQSPKFTSWNKLFLFGSALMVVMLVGGFVVTKRYFKTNNQTAVDSQRPEPAINYNPPTEQDKKTVDQHKEDLSKPTQPSDNSSGPKVVTPVVIDASQYGDQIEVRAYVPGIFENGGTCTASFTKGNLVVTKKSSGEKDATTTRCSNMTIPRAEFATPGDWQFSLSYQSATAQGKSSTKVVGVQ